MTKGENISRLISAISCSIGLMVFSFFVQYGFPVKVLSFFALLISGYIISSNLKSWNDLKVIIGIHVSQRKLLLFTFIAFVSGLVFGVMYRYHLDLNLFPESFHLFVFAAAFIGIMEELVFRGFLQGFVKSINGPFSILFGTLSHTGYKCCLFLAPVITEKVDIWFLFIWTFGVGLLFGIVRHYTKSVFIPLLGHAVFDILAYAEFCHSPWWVW
jgi:membrane protease YdiL (CAAX protease family)